MIGNDIELFWSGDDTELIWSGAAPWLYQNISTAHIQTADFLKKHGAWAKLTQADQKALETAFQNIQAHATDSDAWKAVGDAHTIADTLFKKGLAPKIPPQALQDELHGHFQRISSWMPGGAGPLKAIAATLGGAAKSLANGIAIAAKYSGKVFTDVTSSPLWKIAAGVAPFVLPGIGLAVSAGMVTAAAIGKAGSVKDALIGAARANLPGGEAAKAGFDVATGIAIHGEGMTEASLNAVRNQVPNGPAKAGFDAALTLHAGRATAKKPAPSNLNPQGRVAFYAAKGALAVKAPPAMKKAVAEMTIHTPAAAQGLKEAIKQEVNAKNISWLEWLWQEMRHTAANVHGAIVGRPIPKTIITTRGEVVP